MLDRFSYALVLLLGGVLSVGCGSDSSQPANAGGAGGAGAAGGGGGSSGGGGTGGSSGSGGSGGGGGTGGVIKDPPINGCSNITSGWTDLTPSANSRVVYVSNSMGDDQNDGLSENTPVKTLEHASDLLRMGSPDWLLLKRGDTFRGERLGNWRIYGTSPSEPAVIGAYGDASQPRPRVIPPAGSGLIQTQGGGGVDSHELMHDLVIMSIHIEASNRVPGGPDFQDETPSTAITFLRPFDNVLFEDLLVEWFATNLVIQPDANGGAYGGTGFRLRRSVIRDAYNLDANGHSQGIFIAFVDQVSFEENVFDHNGWEETISDAGPTQFNHNFYVQSNCGYVELTRNVIMRGSSHGFQLRPGGLAQDNLLIGNGIAGFVAADNAAVTINRMDGNVVLHAGQQVFINGQGDRGWGLEMIGMPSGATADNNIVAHSGPIGRNALKLGSATGMNNVVYMWGNESDPGPFTDPTRDIASYHTSIGGMASVDSFINGARAQAKGRWCSEYATEDVLPYIRAGY